MAKEQNLSLNPTKISGNCGRLMCCLKYESNVYEDKLEKLPKVGAIVKTEDGEGEVDNIETLKEVVRVKFRDGDTTTFKKYPAKDIKVIKNIETEKVDEEELEHKKELEELEKLEEEDKKIEQAAEEKEEVQNREKVKEKGNSKNRNINKNKYANRNNKRGRK